MKNKLHYHIIFTFEFLTVDVILVVLVTPLFELLAEKLINAFDLIPLDVYILKLFFSLKFTPSSW